MRARGRGLRRRLPTAPWTTRATPPAAPRARRRRAPRAGGRRADHRALRDAPDDRRAALRRRRRVGRPAAGCASPTPQPLDAPALAMFADAWWPSPMPRLTRPVAAPTIDLTVHFRAPAAAAAIAEEPVLAVFRSSTAAGGFFEEDGELWSARRRPAGPLAPARAARGRRAMTIDDVLPTWDWRSAHATRVAASPERAAAARARVQRARPAGDRRAHARPHAAGGARSTTVRPSRRWRGSASPVLADEPYAVLLGGVLSPWRVRGGHRAIASAEELRAFARAGLGARRDRLHGDARGRRLPRARPRRGSPPPTTRRAGASGATGA